MKSKRIGQGGGRSILLVVVDAFTLLLTSVVGVALLFAYFAPYVHPDRIIWFALLGLVAPFLYIINVLLMLYWAARWHIIALFLLCLTVIGVGQIGKFYRPRISREYAPPTRAEGTIRVLSYNVRGFLGEHNGSPISRLQEMTDYIREQDPDIVCLQEYEVNEYKPKVLLDSLLSQLKYNAVSYAIEGGGKFGWGLAIYSKFRVIARKEMKFPGSSNSAMWVDLVMRRDTLRVFNCHLQSTQVNEQDREFLGTEFGLDTLSKGKAKGIVRKLARNFRLRAQQADSLAPHIHDPAATPWVIVCGDFNDTPMSYTYHTMRGDLVDAFQEKGHGVVYTYRGLFGVFRIDYIFHSRNFEPMEYKSELPEWSDHNPVIVDLKMKPKQRGAR